MAASLFTDGTFQGFDSNGDPLASGKLYTYAAGTTTNQATYTTQALSVANANPVVLDSNGRAAVWLDSSLGNYKMVLKDSSDVTIWTTDEIAVPTTSEVVDDLTPQLGGPLDVNGNAIVSASNGNISITPNGTGDIILDGQKFPQADGTAGQFLTTDGAGQLSWGVNTVVIDTSPQLGGSLDVNGNSIISASNGDINITPNGTGDVVIDGLKHPQADGSANDFLQTDGAGQLSFAIPQVSADTTPQLGGNLDVNGNSIVSASAGNISITPDTTGDIILDGQKWPQADGSANQFLKTDGAGQLAWASRGWTQIASTTASASANITFTGLTTYNRLRFVLKDLDPASDDVELQMTVSTDNGCTFLSTGYDGSITQTTGTAEATTTYAQVIGLTTGNLGQGNASTEEANGVIYFEDVTGTTADSKTIMGNIAYETSVGTAVIGTSVYRLDTSSAINAVKFAYNTGNIQAGTIAVYGM